MTYGKVMVPQHQPEESEETFSVIQGSTQVEVRRQVFVKQPSESPPKPLKGLDREPSDSPLTPVAEMLSDYAGRFEPEAQPIVTETYEFTVTELNGNSPAQTLILDGPSAAALLSIVSAMRMRERDLLC